MASLPGLYDARVAVIGLGYVGLPLAVQIAKTKSCFWTRTRIDRVVLGYDINTNRLKALKDGIDTTGEILDAVDLALVNYTSDASLLAEADVFIITVPTPVDSYKKPDFSYILSASHIAGIAIKARSLSSRTAPVIIYESTVYPGATEEVCVPEIEKSSGLRYNKEFYCGYSPERINPGDRRHTISEIVKVTSGSTEECGAWVDQFYKSFIKAGTHKASSIKVAEASKVIENTQRDLNVAFMNELAILFSILGIDTHDVLAAARSKWNFLDFKPGLVGGHCIGVDPYYLLSKAAQVGYHPELITAGRKINDGMGTWIADQLIFKLANSRSLVPGAAVLVYGFTFKEDCLDIRNTRVIDLVRRLEGYGLRVTVVDPIADPEDAWSEYRVRICREPEQKAQYSAIVLAVAHNAFMKLSASDWQRQVKPGGIIFDAKGIVPSEANPFRL